MQDVTHPTRLGAWISAPIVIVTMTVIAAVSGSLTFLGRIAAAGIEGILLGFGLFRRLGALPSRLRAIPERLLTLRPESKPGRQSDHAFHALTAAPAATGPVISTDQDRALVAQALANAPAKGDPTLPDDIATLAALLASPPPTNDFKAADMVRDCFASLGAASPSSRALLAVAIRLSREFGGPARLPLATVRAWRMLDPVLFEDEMAAQLTAISQFISNWQKTQQIFLCLEFGEIELIEFLFETLPPIRHADILAEVLNFKVLSNRRQGILRRIPHRLRKFVQNSGGKGPDVLAHVEATRILLDQIAATRNYPPIVAAAAAALEEVGKFAEKLRPPPTANAAQSGPAGQGQPLARITPVKRPASELADQAMAATRRAAPPPATPPAQAPAAQTPAAQTIQPRLAGRRAIASGPHLSTALPPFKSPDGIGTSSTRPLQPAVSAAARPLPPGSRPPLPTVAMSPLPILALGAPPSAKPPPPALTGRIALRPPTTTGAEAKGSVTALTVVPKTKRPPITQAVKRQSVLKVLRGESAAAVAATLGIRESKLDEWIDAFVTAGVGALTSAPRKERKAKALDDAPLSAEMLRTKLAEVLATAQMIERAMDAQLPPRRPVLLLPPDSSGHHHGAAKRPHKKG